MSLLRRSWSALVLVCGLFPCVVGGCSLKGAVDDAGTVDVDAEVDVRELLRVLFPKLTAAEIDELSTSIDLETVLALKAELEKVRAEAAEFSDELFTTCEERVEQRKTDLATKNDGYPTSLEAIGGGAFYSEANGEVRVELSGLFSNKMSYAFGAGDVSVELDGVAQTPDVTCLSAGDSVDLVFLVDVTGSMSNVIDSVRSSLLSFVDALKSSDLDGTISVVSYQDTVGEQVSFQELEKNGFERSPFIAKKQLSSASEVTEVERFIAKLEANRGADLPENLSGAVDFARNSVIGVRSNGSANVIGDGVGDPAGTAAFPKLDSKRQVFIAITDATFHSDSRDADNSSLEAQFRPRPLAQIVESLRSTGTVVHVVDPSWVDESVEPTGTASEEELDADYFAIATGGVGEDKVAGYSLTDLELVAVAEKTGLLDIALHDILKGSCRITFPAVDVAASAEVSVSVTGAGEAAGEVFNGTFAVVAE
ncbi:MAG TPA: vWA domain-containing protein [Polyangiaceae bacterium]|nr:vWA domain-containing protein [Polyangiaceae bacterium]